MRDKTEEGSKGTDNPLRAYARAFSEETFASLKHLVGGLRLKVRGYRPNELMQACACTGKSPKNNQDFIKFV